MWPGMDRFSGSGSSRLRSIGRRFSTCSTGGIAYLALFVYGLIASEKGSENFLPVNNADDVLHAVLSLALLGSWAAARSADDPGRVRGDGNRDRMSS